MDFHFKPGNRFSYYFNDSTPLPLCMTGYAKNERRNLNIYEFGEKTNGAPLLSGLLFIF